MSSSDEHQTASALDGSRALLLDVDGTLVDTTYIHTVCWAQAFAEHGHDVPMVSIRRTIGMGADHLVPHLVGPLDDVSMHRLTATHRALWRAWWPRVRPTRGAQSLLRRSAAAGLRVAVASSAQEDELDAMLSVVGGRECIEVAVSSADVEQSKPDSDVFEAALTRLGLTPAEALCIGDSVWDGLAARRLGVGFVGVLCGGTSGSELTRAGAVLVREDPEELLSDLPLHSQPVGTGRRG